jgi:alpha-galactosidase
MSQDVTDSPNGKRPKDETPSKSSKKRGSSSSNKKKTSSSFEFDNIELSKPFNVEKRGKFYLIQLTYYYISIHKII